MIAALASKIRLKHGYTAIFLLALAAVLST